MPNTNNDTPSLIKEPYKKTVFKDDDELTQFMKCVDPINGPRYFMSHFFKIQHPTKGSQTYIPFPYQEKLIDTYHGYRSSIS